MNALSPFYTETLAHYFVRNCPAHPLYFERLKREFALIKEFKFEQTFLQVREILQLSKGIPHIIRGSAGSSLVCYLMGITNIDPLKENIALSRFMNSHRPDMPDIDIDFPYNRRDEIIERARKIYGERLVRISNHVTFSGTSALRKAMRRHGYKRFLPKYFDVHKLMGFKAEQVLKTANELQGQFKGYSLHCGGIIIFDKPVEKELLLKPGQIKLDKRDVEKQGLIKIDLLSNRGLAQLLELSDRPLENYPEYDAKTAALFSRGDVLGVTFSESPAMMRLLKAIKPKSRRDVALCLALVRPAAASRGRKLSFLKEWQKRCKQTQIVFEDDANTLIRHLLKISDDESDFYRRAFAKGDEVTMARFKSLIDHLPKASEHMESLSMMREYSFCKSHAVSYSYLAWALAYWKVRNPKQFWYVALKHCQSMYAKWVHVNEAKRAGLTFATAGSNWVRDGDTLYDKNRTPFLFHDGYGEYKKHGFWLSNRFMPGCTEIRIDNKIRLRGLIATYRKYRAQHKKLTFVTAGTANGTYWDLVLEGNLPLHEYDMIDISGEVKEFFNSRYIQVKEVHGFKKLAREWDLPINHQQEMSYHAS